MDPLSTLVRLFTSYGYAIVFLGVMLESAGIPLPGETILLAAGFFASQGHFSLPLVVLLGASGAMLGDNLGYWAGRRLGRPFVERYGRYLWLTPERIAAGEGFFARHGDKTIVLARFISGLRVLAALFAGMSRMPWRTFIIYNAAGAALWATGIALVGYFFGHSWRLVERWMGRASLFVFGLLVAWLAFTLLRKWQRRAAAGEDRTRWPLLETRELAIVLFNLILIAFFIELALRVAERRDPRFDHIASLWVHRQARPWLDAVMLAVTHLGDAPVLIAAGLAVSIYFFRRYRRRREALTMLLALGVGYFANTLFKLSFQRARPQLWGWVVNPHGYSFPSGHAMVSTVVYGGAAFLLSAAFPQWRRVIGPGAAVLIFLIGLSRVYLGVHWPSDVLAGFAAGTTILFIVAYWYKQPSWLPARFGGSREEVGRR